MSAIYYTDEHGNPLRPPRWWIGYLAGAVCTLLGIIVPCGGMMALYSSYYPDRGTSIQPPGTAHVSITDHKRVVVWVEETDDSLNGGDVAVPKDLKVVVTGSDGKPVLTHKPHEELTSTLPDSERIGACFFDPAATGDYAVAVTGTFKPAQTIAVGPDEGNQAAAFGLGFLMMLLLGGGLLLGGIITLIVTIVRHIKHPGVGG